MTSAALHALSTSARWRIVAMLAGCAALGHFNRVCISVAGAEVFIPQLGITEERMGWVYSAFLLVYTILMMPGGLLIDRIGAARALTLFGVSMGALAALTGALAPLAAAPASLWLGLMVVRSLAGICNVPLHPAAAHVVSDVMPGREQASANGMVTAGALVGVACSYPIFGWLMDRIGWPLTFVVCGLVLMAFGLLWRLIAQPRLPGPAVATTDASQRVESSAAPVESPTVSPMDFVYPRNARSLLRHADLWLITISYAAYGYFQYLFFYWTNYYFETVLHVDKVESRNIAFVVTLAQGAGMALGGLSTDFLCRRLGMSTGRRTIVVVGMGLGGAFGLLGVFVTGKENVAVCLALAMAALGMCEGVFWTTATDIGRHARGFAAAFMNTGGNAGGVFSPVLTPLLASWLGWSGAITVACAIAALGGAMWFVIQIPDHRLAGAEP